MPRYDRTGPDGKGSKTGRGMGKCNESKKQENKESRFGRPSRRRQRRGEDI